jgi:hypothetical protein
MLIFFTNFVKIILDLDPLILLDPNSATGLMRIRISGYRSGLRKYGSETLHATVCMYYDLTSWSGVNCQRSMALTWAPWLMSSSVTSKCP